MLISFLGGLALFLYGQFLLENTLQKTSRIYLQGIFRLLSRSKTTAILTGSILAVGMQSSTIPVFTLIGLINRGILQLGQAIGIIIGASIGTTITVQVITFNITGYSLWFIIAGLFISKILKYTKAEILAGFGFMFYGISLISGGVTLFKGTPFGNFFLSGICTNPFQNMLGAFVLTILSQSTIAALAVGIVLIRNGGMEISCAIPIILGAHLGAGILPLFYSLKVRETGPAGQLGIASFLYRAIGVILFLPFLTPFTKLTCVISQFFGAGPERQLANAHTIFVITTAGVLSLFVNPYVKFVKKIISKEKIRAKEKLDISEILKNAETKMLEGTFQAFCDSLCLWEENSLKKINIIERQCRSLRQTEERTWKKLTGKRNMRIEEKEEKSLKTIGNLGDITDNVYRTVDLARRRILQGLNFSIEGLTEILNIHKSIIGEFELIKQNKNIQNLDNEIESLISASYKSHIERVSKGFHETKETRLLHTDAITLLEYIHWHIKKIASGGIA